MIALKKSILNKNQMNMKTLKMKVMKLNMKYQINSNKGNQEIANKTILVNNNFKILLQIINHRELQITQGITRVKVNLFLILNII